jgi:hypothetical protein
MMGGEKGKEKVRIFRMNPKGVGYGAIPVRD